MRSPTGCRPLAGQVALVTGASRGIGEQIARVLHRDGATVIGVDVPQAADSLVKLTNELEGDYLALDITAKDAPQRIAHQVLTEHGGVDVVVHNAGITRDKKLANMDEDRWESVIGVNLTAPERITRELLDQKAHQGQRPDHRRRLDRRHRRQRRARPTTPRPRPASSAWSTPSRTTCPTASP